MTLTTLIKKYLRETDCTPHDSHFVIWWRGKEKSFVKVENLN